MGLGAVGLLATAAFTATATPACDRTNPDDFVDPDGATDAAPATDASTADGSFDGSTTDDALDALDSGPLQDGGGRCTGSTYTSAPDGGACDPLHVLYVQGRGGTRCFAPPDGTFCDVLQLSVAALDASSLPPGFVCGSAELGVTTCRYPLTDGGTNGTLDDAAIAAACAVTAALPQTTVTCIVYD
jgi:hypothetical protein